jgi:peptidoglycan-N-acetylglucosamine deacetylase
MKTLALSIDLDGPSEYARLHGLDETGADPALAYGAPLTRFAELCESAGGRGSVFAIGRDVHGDNARTLRELAGMGFDIGSHSFSHDYGLSRRAAAVMHHEVVRGRDAVGEATGQAPRGFRAPGHHLSAALLDAIEAAGFAYDSSVLPSPPYYVAKAAVLGAYALLGRASAAMLGSPRVALAPRLPYRPGRDPYAAGHRQLVELPISVATVLGLPATGAALVLAPPPLRHLMVEALAELELVVLNLHALDLADPTALPPALAARQPELRTSWAERQRIVRDVVSRLARGRIVRTLDATARGDGALTYSKAMSG